MKDKPILKIKFNSDPNIAIVILFEVLAAITTSNVLWILVAGIIGSIIASIKFDFDTRR